MSDDPEEILKEFNVQFKLKDMASIVGGLAVRVIRLEARLEAIAELYPEVAAAALLRDEETLQQEIDETEKRVRANRLADFLSAYGIPKDVREIPPKDPSME